MISKQLFNSVIEHTGDKHQDIEKTTAGIGYPILKKG
jgi:hypothetical protein